MTASTNATDQDGLSKFTETHIDEKMEGVAGREFDNALFFNCTFDSVRDLTLKNCDLNRSKLNVERIEDALGFCLSLDCNSFSSVEYSPLLFDLLIVLMLKSKGNTEKRRKLIDVIGEDRLRELLSAMSRLER